MLLPEEFGGPALQHEEEEEEGRVELGNDYDGPDDYFMDRGNGDAEQEDANADFEGHEAEDIGGFAGPPPLRIVRLCSNQGHRAAQL